MKINQLLCISILSISTVVWTAPSVREAAAPKPGERSSRPAAEAEDPRGKELSSSQKEFFEKQKQEVIAKKAEAARKKAEQEARDNKLFTDSPQPGQTLDLFGEAPSAMQPAPEAKPEAPVTAQASTTADSGVSVFRDKESDIFGRPEHEEGLFIGESKSLNPSKIIEAPVVKAAPSFPDFTDEDAIQITSTDLSKPASIESTLPSGVQPLEIGDQEGSSAAKRTGPASRSRVTVEGTSSTSIVREVIAPDQVRSRLESSILENVDTLKSMQDSLAQYKKYGGTPAQISEIEAEIKKVKETLDDSVDAYKEQALSVAGLEPQQQVEAYQKMAQVYDALASAMPEKSFSFGKSADDARSNAYSIKKATESAEVITDKSAPKIDTTAQSRSLTQTLRDWGNNITSGKLLVETQKLFTQIFDPSNHETLAQYNEQLSNINANLGRTEAALQNASEAVKSRLQQMLKDPTTKLENILKSHQDATSGLVDISTLSPQEGLARDEYQASVTAMNMMLSEIQRAQESGKQLFDAKVDLRESLSNKLDEIEKRFPDLALKSKTWESFTQKLLDAADQITETKVSMAAAVKEEADDWKASFNAIQPEELDINDTTAKAKDILAKAKDTFNAQEEARQQSIKEAGLQAEAAQQRYQETLTQGKDAFAKGDVESVIELAREMDSPTKREFYNTIAQGRGFRLAELYVTDATVKARSVLPKAPDFPALRDATAATVSGWANQVGTWASNATVIALSAGLDGSIAAQNFFTRTIPEAISQVKISAPTLPESVKTRLDAVSKSITAQWNKATGRTAERQSIGATPSQEELDNRAIAMGSSPAPEAAKFEIANPGEAPGFLTGQKRRDAVIPEPVAEVESGISDDTATQENPMITSTQSTTIGSKSLDIVELKQQASQLVDNIKFEGDSKTVAKLRGQLLEKYKAILADTSLLSRDRTKYQRKLDDLQKAMVPGKSLELSGMLDNPMGQSGVASRSGSQASTVSDAGSLRSESMDSTASGMSLGSDASRASRVKSGANQEIEVAAPSSIFGRN